MKYFLAKLENANADITIFDHEPSFCESKEITEQEALEALYNEIDPHKNYKIDDYKLIHSGSLNRYGITYA